MNKGHVMTIRQPTALGASVQDTQALLSAVEALLVARIGEVVATTVEAWNKFNEPNEPRAIRGICVIDPLLFAHISRAFGHKTADETTQYVESVIRAASIMPHDGLKLILHVLEVADSDNYAYELLLVATEDAAAMRRALQNAFNV